MPRFRLPMAAVLLTVGLSGSGCTLAKPFVCAVSTPIYVLGQSDTCCGCDPRGLACAFAVIAAVGVVGGLVTGIISDINVLCGCAPDPCRNFADPFATNTSRRSF